MADAPKKGSLVRAALEALSQGNHAEAIRCCKHALKQDRHHYDALLVLGKALFSSKQYEQAEIPYKRAAEINPDDVRAWRGLTELYEATENYEKVVDACRSVIRLCQSLGDQTHLNEYRRRLAIAYASLHNHEDAVKSWESLLEGECLSETLYLEVLCGIVDAKAAIMENHIQEACNKHLRLDHDLDNNRARCIAENEWSRKEENTSMEEMTCKILKLMPDSEKYETLLLQLLVWRMRANSPSKGKEWRNVCMQVLRLCLSSLQWHGTSRTLQLLLALCEEDRVDSVFNEMGMVELGQERNDRFQILGKKLIHMYPDQDLVSPILVFIMHHQSASCSVSLENKRLLCENSLRSNEKNIIGWQVLAEMKSSEGAHFSVSECVKRGLQVIDTFRSLYGLNLKYAELRFRLILGNSLLNMGRVEEALTILNGVGEAVREDDDREASSILVSAREGQVKAFLHRGSVEEASEMLQTLLDFDKRNSWALAEQGWIAYQKKDFEQAIKLLETAVNLKPESARYHYQLGLAYLTSNISETYKEMSLNHLLKSARLDSSQSEVFRVLGNYYKDVPNGSKTAVRCYQKAVELNSDDEEAGEALCDMLDEGGQVLLEISTCQEAVQKSPRSFWAFRRLGYLQMHRKEWSDAAKNLQHAVRGYPDCVDVWEALALAYQQLGMLTAALKAYGRAINLQKTSVFALQQSGNILLMLGLYRKAVSMFETALEKSPNHPASLYGLASALLRHASECRSMGAIRLSASLLKEAIAVASESVKKYGNFVSFWKLLGDIQLSCAKNLPWQLLVDSANVEASAQPQVAQGKQDTRTTFDESIKSWNTERMISARKAKEAYQHALHLQPNKGNLYLDLCLCLNMIYTLNQDNNECQSRYLCMEAVALCGLGLEGGNADLWTTLGVIARNKGIQQHALIQALYVDGDHALAWAQLGQLYLNEGAMDLANEAFTRSRSVDPNLSFTWAAMASMCASGTPEEMQEAYANILYAAQLLPIADFQLGLAKIAMLTHQLDSQQVYAAVDQAVLQAPHRPEVHNLKGLVYELRGEYLSAIAAFKTSLAALESTMLMSNTDSLSKRYAITVNLARCFCKAGDASSAVEEYESLAKSSNLEECAALRGYATALWKQKKYKLAFSIAKVALKKSIEQSAVHAAVRLLVRMAYFLSGPAAALEELRLSNADVQSEPVLSLTACAIASIAGRNDILMRMMSQWGVLFYHDRAVEFVCLAALSMQFSKDIGCGYDIREGVLLFQKTIHMHPQSLVARMKLTRMLLDRSNGIEVGLAARCCSLASFSKFYNAGYINDLSETCGATVLACSVCGGIRPDFSFSSCKSLSGSNHSCILELQRLVHLEPWRIMSQYQLVLCLMQQVREQKFPNRACQTIQHMAQIILSRISADDNISEETQHYMRLQLLLCCSEAYLHSGKNEMAVATATDAASLQLPVNLLVLPQLQLVRCHAVSCNRILMDDALLRMHNLGPLDFPVWVSVLNVLSYFGKKETSPCAPIEMPIYNHIPEALLQWRTAQHHIQKGDLISAEKAASNAATLWPEMLPLHLLHGAICVELVRGGSSMENLSYGIRRLLKLVSDNTHKLPIAGLLLAQSQSVKTGTPAWERLIRAEWALWPAEHRPAELYFQIGLLKLSSSSNMGPAHVPNSHVPSIWFKRAVHLNPSCARYWEMVIDGNELLHS